MTSTVIEWRCHCRVPGVLLGVIDPPKGTVTIKCKERVWIVRGEVTTTCPRCAARRSSEEVGR